VAAGGHHPAQRAKPPLPWRNANGIWTKNCLTSNAQNLSRKQQGHRTEVWERRRFRHRSVKQANADPDRTIQESCRIRDEGKARPRPLPKKTYREMRANLRDQRWPLPKRPKPAPLRFKSLLTLGARICHGNG